MRLLSMLVLMMLAMFLGVEPATAQSASGSSEEIRFETAKSMSLSAETAKWEFGPPLKLSGTLTLPAGSGPFALVVLAHGCEGITPAETRWARVLNSWGYATFIMDSLTGRNLAEVCTKAPALRPIQRVPDAYGALAALSKHPKIDPKRAALMGFSHGGGLALGAATTWARKEFATGGPAFRAFVAFYPANCNAEYPERLSTYAPVRIHIGALDDWTPASQCVRLVDALNASQQDADITIYPGAYHKFDYPDLQQTRLPDVDNGAACTIRFASVMGPVVPPVEGFGCVKKGATVAGHREAADKAEKLVRSQLAGFLK
jgi:dienelactone hydrolase